MLNGGGCPLIHDLTLNIHHLALAAGDDRPDFNLIAVVQHLVLSHEIIAFYDEMSFDDEIQFTQELFDFFGTFDLDGPGWMAQLNVHGGIISFHVAGGKGHGRRDE